MLFIHTDITILAFDGSIGAHREVLASRSPVFDCMFIHNFKEKDFSSISIPDILYLIKAADKYDVIDMKDVCHESLIDDIDSENVLERLQTAFMYRILRLKVSCIEYLVKFGEGNLNIILPLAFRNTQELS
ncbi:BTB/POZ domain-containing protein [Tanacetum coccineum]